MADVSAEDSLVGREPESVEHTTCVRPSDADLCRDAEFPRLVAECRDDGSKLVDLDGVELPVAIGRVDAVHAGGVEPPDVFAKHALVEPVIRIEGRGDGRPHAMQVLTGYPLGHQGAGLHRHCYLTGPTRNYILGEAPEAE